MRTKVLRGLLPLGIATTAMQASAQAYSGTYFIDEGLDYTGNGCENDDLNDITSDLRSELNANYWTGLRFTNGSTIPSDFIEQCSSSYNAGTYTGGDASWADNKLLAVYAGHGYINSIQFSHSSSGRPCSISLQQNIRLGQMSGAKSGYAIYGTSCTMNTSSLAGAGSQWLRQQFGFHNSPAIGDSDLGNFFAATGSKTNKNAWLDELEDRPGWGTGDNSPVAYSKSTTSSGALNIHNYNQFRGYYFLNSPIGGGPSCNNGQGSWYFYYSIRNNGGC